MPPALMSLLGVGADDTIAILQTLGYRVTDANEGLAVQPKKAPRKRFNPKRPQADGDAPAQKRGKGPHKGKGGKPPHKGKGGKPAPKRDEKPKEIDPDSPFAVLKNWGKS